MSRKLNTFDVIENYTGNKLTEKSIPDLLKLNREEFIELIERIRFRNRASHWFTDGDELPKQKPTIRQAILTDTTGAADSFEIWSEHEQIKNLLLYYPEIAVLDPIDETLNLTADIPEILVKQLRMLLPLRKLIDDRVVDLIPAVTGRQAIREQLDLGSLFEHVLGCDDLTDLLKAIKYHSPENYSIVEEMNVELPGFALTDREKKVVDEILNQKSGEIKKGLIMLSAIVIKELYIQNYMSLINDCNLGLISRNQINFFSKIGGLDYGQIEKLGDPSDLKSEFLIKLNVPNIKDINWQDVNYIRDDDKNFYTWRNAMKEVLSESQTRGIYDTNKFIINAKETMIAHSRYLENEVKGNKSLKSKIKDVSSQTGIGFVGALLSGSIEVALLTSSVTGALLLAHQLFSNKATKGEEALYKHFSIFI